MTKIHRILAILAAAYAVPAASETPLVSLADYAFDFPTYGYEIMITGTTQNLLGKLTANEHITIDDNGYQILTLIDRMGRKDRQGFIRFFNAHCIGFGAGNNCSVTATGEVELNDQMQMIFRMNSASIAKGGDAWSNVSE